MRSLAGRRFSLALTVDESREDHYSLDEPWTVEFEYDIHLAPYCFLAHRTILDVGLIVHYRLY